MTVTISGHAGTDLSIASAGLSGDDELTFTTANWGTAQTVTVKAAEDDDGVTDADVILAHAISSADDAAYDALSDQSVTVSITEDDAVGVTVSPTTLTVTEGDATGVSYTVVLTSQPAGDVTVTISGHAGTDLSIASAGLSGDDELTFTTENWGTAQTVTVKAAEDDDGVTDADVILAHAISSADDAAYDALADQSVTVSITENDAVGVTISPMTLTVPEGDATGVDYTVVLTSQPAGDVTVTVSGHSGTDLTLSGETLTNNVLTFSTTTWETAQTVTVKAAEDDDGVVDADITLAHAISSDDDSTYDALANVDLVVSITENDADGVTISPTTLTVTEGDATGVNYTVVLTSQPAGDVTVTISGHAGTDLSIASAGLSGDDELTFTTENWGTAQTVTVKAAEDDDGVTDADVILAHAISSADDAAYDALSDQSVTVSITEDDVVGVTVSPTTLSVTEGDAAGVSYTVVLTSQPAGDVTVTISGHAGTDLSIASAGLSGDDELTFTTENWGTAQTVTVKAAEDDDGVTDADVILAHAISSTDDSTYDALADQSVTVSITENDAVGVTVNPHDPDGDRGRRHGGQLHGGADQPARRRRDGDDQWPCRDRPEHRQRGAERRRRADLHHGELGHGTDGDGESRRGRRRRGGCRHHPGPRHQQRRRLHVRRPGRPARDGEHHGERRRWGDRQSHDPDGDRGRRHGRQLHGGADVPARRRRDGDDQWPCRDRPEHRQRGAERRRRADLHHGELGHGADGDGEGRRGRRRGDGRRRDPGPRHQQRRRLHLRRPGRPERDGEHHRGRRRWGDHLAHDPDGDRGGRHRRRLHGGPHQPAAGDVTVTISGHAGTDLSIASAGLSGDDELTFTTENWGTAQTVTVKAAEDDDGVTDADVILAHAISSADDAAYDALSDQSVTVSITEDDVVGVTVSPTTLSVTEGDAAGVSYTVVLTSQPAGDVTVTISGHAGTDLSIASAGLSGDDELTFTTENWGTAQTVTVKAAEDDDGVTDADVILAHAISSTDDSTYDALADQSVTVSITENDAVGVTVNPTTLTVTEGDATGVSYTVVLTSQPAGDVTVTISGHAGTDLSIASAGLSGDDELTFTTENWGTAQTVTVKAAEDDDGVVDADITLAHAISSDDDSTYDALADQRVTVSITENDADGVTVNPTTLTVTEGDATGVSYTVVLTSQPAGDVTVTISGHAGTDLSIASAGLSGDDELTFTTANWGTAQTVTVKAAEDDDGVTDADVILAHAISSDDDSTYDALADQSVTVSITEDDADGVTISPTTLTVTEGDATGVDYTVVLTSQPAGDVTVTISGHAGTDLSIASAGLSGDDELTFTTENWGTAQTVTVKAAEDDDGVTDADVILAHAISSADDAAYDALSDQSVTVSITEDDAVGVTISPTTLTVPEGDATGVDYTVVLTSQPAGDVTVTVSGHSGTDLTLSGETLTNNVLTFSTTTWETAQTVTVKAAEDDDGVVDADITLAHAISSDDDSTYDALADQSVTVSITENDDPAVTVSFEQEIYSVAEGADVTVKVKLSAIPEREVVVPVTTTNQGGATSSDYSGVPSSVTFQSGDTEKSFTFSATQDTVDDDSESVKLGFGTLPARVTAGTTNEATVSITDDDGQTVTVSFEKEVHYTIEGASGVAGVEVLLSAPLQSEVTIPVTVLSQSTAAPEDYVVTDSAGYASDPGLTFSPGETFGYVFIKAVLDTIDEQTETVVLGFGTLPAGVSEGSPNRSTVEISDAIQVSFADSTYMVQEGGPGVEVMVRLNKASNNLRVPLTANGQGGADDSDFTGVPQDLVFKDDETEKTFTVVAMEDTEEENGEMVRLGFGAFSEGMVAIFPDSAMVMIGDYAGAPAPRHFSASWPTQTSITLIWFTVETAAEYKLEYRKQGESEWTRVRGDFDHLPSTSDHRDAFGVAADLECGTQYEFQLRARGSGDVRNDGNRYSPNIFGSAATTSAQTGECAQVEEVTNLLVSIEQACATLTWTPPSGDRDIGYRVERYYYSDTRSQISEWETLMEQANRIDTQFRDCSDTYKTEGAEHVYIVSALDDEEEFGSAYTSLLRYGPGWEPEGPLNVRLTLDTQSSRRLAWDAPRDPWLTTVKTARAGAGPQRVALDPWVTGYRVERREYRRTEGGDWELQDDWETLRDETDGDTGTSFTDSKDKGDKQYVYRVWAYNDWGRSRYSFRGDWAFNGGDPGGNPEAAEYIPPPPAQQQGGETPSNNTATGLPGISGTPQVDQTLTVDTSPIDDEDGLTNVSYSYQWIAGGSDIDGATGVSFTLTASQQGQTIQVRVAFTDDADNTETLTSEATAEVTAAPNRSATGKPGISGTPQVEQTLTADTSPIDDADGLTNVSYAYQWLAAGTAISGGTGSSLALTASQQGQTIQVRVDFEDDAGNAESLTSVATDPVAAKPVPLTASFSNVPSHHDGSAEFTFRVLFSEDVGISYVNMRDDAFTVNDGDVETAKRVDGRHDLWEITVEPDDNSDVVITLPANRSCTTAGAICTREDSPRQLTNSPSATVPGPTDQSSSDTTDDTTGEPTATSQLSVANATASEEDDSTIDFVVTLNPAGEASITVDYATANGTANAGSDYTAQSGTLTFTAGETSQTVTVAIIDDTTEEDDETLTLTLSNPSGAEISDGQATGTITDSEPVPLTVSFSNVPASHDGSTEFTFDLAFSENFPLGYATLRDHAFAINGGTIEQAQRKVQGSNQNWTIKVKPAGNGTVSITLPETTDCSTDGAICTDDGRMLSHSTSVSVAGPS